jgi:phosphoglycerate dehydrogenase-like enzyme
LPSFKIAVLDDYQNVALTMADWSPLNGRADVTVFNDTLSDTSDVIERLQPFDIVCVMRERTPLSRRIIEALPNLKLIASTGPANQSIDTVAATELGIAVSHTGYTSTPTIELTWALISALARNLSQEIQSLRAGGWQVGVGEELAGKTLGLLGLGRVGAAVGAIGRAFGMEIISWSQNLTVDRARENGARLVSKDELFATSDYLSIHVRLSARTLKLVGDAEFDKMKPTARLINTSRAAIVDEAALLRALTEKRIAGAALDVFEVEPVRQLHSAYAVPNVIATPHIGFVSKELYRTFYGDTVKNIVGWLDKSTAA